MKDDELSHENSLSIDVRKLQSGVQAAYAARALNRQGVKGKRGGKWQGSTVVRVTANLFHKDREIFG
jgi:hypothetical protein